MGKGYLRKELGGSCKWSEKSGASWGGDLGHGAEGQLEPQGCLILPTMAHVRALRAAQVGSASVSGAQDPPDPSPSAGLVSPRPRCSELTMHHDG